MTAVVPAYRCGTVPDSHRIPLTDNERRLARQGSGLQMQNWNPFLIQPFPYMESANGQRQLVCESCGASFGCCPAPQAGCWCADVNVSDNARADLKARFGDCICPDCLAKYAQKEPTARA